MQQRPILLKLIEARQWQELLDLANTPSFTEDLQAKNEHGESSLHLAVKYNAPISVIQLILSHGLQPNEVDKLAGNTAVHVAAESNVHIQTMALLLDYGGDINSICEEGITPLHLAAAANSDPQLVQFIVQKGGNRSVKDENGRTPLHYAAANGVSSEVVAQLIVSQEQLGERDNDESPMHSTNSTVINPNIPPQSNIGADRVSHLEAELRKQENRSNELDIKLLRLAKDFDELKAHFKLLLNLLETKTSHSNL